MRISASIYSDKKRDLHTTITDLVAHHVDLFHVDCNDDPAVFEDIKKLREWSTIPVDLHIITATPSRYYDLLREVPVDYVTFQLEDLKEPLHIPSDITGKKGLGIVTPTSVEAFKDFEDFDFILLMATVPGQSGGVFDASNFKKIRDFQKHYPTKSIHVDGGVNGEVSFILRSMGVHTSVSGSYLFNAPSIGHALMDLTKRSMDSKFLVQDFMIPLFDSPVVFNERSNTMEVLTAIERGNLGFTLVLGADNELAGLISNADVRKAMIQHNGDLSQVDGGTYLNKSPLVLTGKMTVNEMLNQIKQCNFPISYLPVVDESHKAIGIVTFVNLIKGEL